MRREQGGNMNLVPFLTAISEKNENSYREVIKLMGEYTDSLVTTETLVKILHGQRLENLEARLLVVSPELTKAMLDAGANPHANYDWALQKALATDQNEIANLLLKA